MTRDEMVLAVASKHGLEADITIWFASLAEETILTDTQINLAFACAMAYAEPEEKAA